MVNLKVNYHHHVLHLGHMGHFLIVPHVGHLHIIAHTQCYCFQSILYNSGLVQLERMKVNILKLLCKF